MKDHLELFNGLTEGLKETEWCVEKRVKVICILQRVDEKSASCAGEHQSVKVSGSRGVKSGFL